MKPVHYKYLSIALAVIALTLAFLYFSRPEPTISDINENLGDRVQGCTEDVAAWKEKYDGQASSTEKETALQTVLAKCQEELAKGKKTITP